MFKLVIIVEAQDDMAYFEARWPEFLRQAEQMPGLIQETFSPVHAVIYGDFQPAVIHELHFESRQDLRAAMDSPEGQAAGHVLQQITDGRVTLLFADHLEDKLENIRGLKQAGKGEADGDA